MAERGLLRRLRRRIGGCTGLHDRYLLEDVIFPALRSRPDVTRVLFVGCERYTRDYPALFSDRELTTIDIDPGKARYGAERHIADSVTNLRSHLEPESLDAVICNGVIGWGVDSREQVEAALGAFHACLRPGGVLVLGWNDVEGRRPPLALDSREAMNGFVPITLPPFPGPVYPVLGPLRHVYSFYSRESQ